jgi:hypothetical protein
MKLLEEKLGNNLPVIFLGNYFFNMITKTQAV